MSRYACVADQKAAGFPVTTACEIAEVSTSGFYDWSARAAAGPTERQLADDALVELIREIFDTAEGAYGVPRIHRELRDAGVVVDVKRVRRLMRLHGMAGRCIRRTCRTTIPGPDGYTIPISCNGVHPGRLTWPGVRTSPTSRLVKAGSTSRR